MRVWSTLQDFCLESGGTDVSSVQRFPTYWKNPDRERRAPQRENSRLRVNYADCCQSVILVLPRRSHSH